MCLAQLRISSLRQFSDIQVPEEEIVESIKVHPKLIRRALKYLEKEQLLMSEHRRETRRGQKRDVVKAVLNANAEAEKVAGEDDEDVIELLERPHTISYYAVDFPRLFDVVQLRLHNMKKALKVRKGLGLSQAACPCRCLPLSSSL